MTYEASEISVHDAKPVELFMFEGTYANFFYTSGPRVVIFEGNTYVPETIRRSDVAAGTQEDDGLDVTIEVPASTDLAQTYGFSGTPPSLYLTVFRFHRDAMGDYVPYWRGPITNIQTTGGISSLRSPSALAHALVGDLPNVYFQTPCNHVLYDSRCAVVEEDFTVVTTTSAIDGMEITVVTVGALDGMLVGGELSLVSGERRMIISQAGNVVMVNFPFFALLPGTAVSLVAGCDHNYLGDCATRFANQIRYGGFPFIPNDNIFSEGIQPGYTCPDGTCLPVMFTGWDYEFTTVAVCTIKLAGFAGQVYTGPDGFLSGGDDETIIDGLTRTKIKRVAGEDSGVGTGVGHWQHTYDPQAVDPFPFTGNEMAVYFYFRHWTQNEPILVQTFDFSSVGGPRNGEWDFDIAWADYR